MRAEAEKACGAKRVLAGVKAGGTNKARRASEGVEVDKVKRTSANVEAGRAKRAFAVVVMLFMALGLASLFGPERLSTEEDLSYGLAFERSHNMAGAALSGDGLGNDEVPAWFADELFCLEGVQSYVGDDVGVYGFVSEGSLLDLSADVQSQMRERGWALTSSADSTYLSFSRSGGDPSSAVVSFTEQELGTTVVVQVMG